MVTGSWESQNLSSHSVEKLYEATQMFFMVEEDDRGEVMCREYVVSDSESLLLLFSNFE